jgi:metal-responsive CopG/Arc/MetJ family transcriptional regulator
MAEASQNISTQIPMPLARKLDARVDAERAHTPVGTVNRSSIIRAALSVFLADVEDPKAEVGETVATSSRGRSRRAIPGVDSPRRRSIQTAEE